MPYDFNKTDNTLQITEQRYGESNEIRFSNFDSCIGLIAKNGNTLTGVHLVMFSNDDSSFDNTAADDAINLLGDYEEVIIIGQANMWNDNLHAPYQHLLAGLNNPQVIDMNNGSYGGRVIEGNFQIYENGEYKDQ